MSLLRRIFLSVAILVFAASAWGQCDGVSPISYVPAVTCTLVNGLCPIGQPVTFELRSYAFVPYLPGPSLSCVSKVVWKFPDGDVVLSPYEPYQRTLPPGYHSVPVQIFTFAYANGITNYGSSFTVGRGLVRMNIVTDDVPEGSPASFTISRNNADLGTTADWVIADSLHSKTPTADVSPASGSVTLAAGQTSQVVSVSTTDDPMFREAKTYYIRFTSTTNDYYIDLENARTWFTVRENDLAVIDFADRQFTFREDAGIAAVKVQRTGFLASPVSVSYVPAGHSTSGTLDFAPDETVKTINVPNYNDNLWKGDRVLEVELSGLPLYARFPNGSSTNRATVTILEDEPTPRLTVTDISIAEGNSFLSAQGTFIVKVSPPVSSLYVDYELVDETAKAGSDYPLLKGSLRFADSLTENFVHVPIFGDTAREPHETFKLRLHSPSIPSIVLPPNATCTILNDDPLLTPSSARIAKGQSQRFSLDIGLPAKTALSVPLTVTDPSILGAPASVPFAAGQSTATFDVTGVAAGSTTVTTKLPQEQGGQTFEATVTVHETGTAVFEPQAISVIAGGEATVAISLKPASSQAQRLQLTIGNSELATAPVDVLVPAGGSGTFKVKGLAPGATYVKAFLPAQSGEGYVIALLDVVERPSTPAITSIEPSSGPSTGGTSFVARGTLLTNACTVLFGGTPATHPTLTSEGMLRGTTPPHAAGPVDVMVQCGTNTFVLTDAFTYLAPPRTRSARH